MCTQGRPTRAIHAATALNHARDLALSSGSIDAPLEAHLFIRETNISVVGSKGYRACEKKGKRPQ